MAIADEIITLIGIKVDPKNAKNVSDFSKSIGGMVRKTAKLGAALIALKGTITAYAISLAESVDEMGKFTSSLDISYEKIQALGYAAGISGGDINTITKDLKTLSKVIDTSNPGSYSEALLQLGISARDANGNIKSSTDLLLDLSDKFATLSQKKAVDFGDKIGLDESTVRLLQEGRAGITALTDEAMALGGVLSDVAFNDAADFNDALLRLRFSFFGVINTVTAKFFPVFTEMAKKISDFVKVNKKWIDLGISQVIDGVIDGFKMFEGAVQKVIDIVSDLLPKNLQFKGDLDATKVIAIAVAGALTSLAIAAASFAAPFVTAAAAVAGLVLIVEDLYTYLNGGDSVIGKFVDSFAEKFPRVFELAKKIGNGIKDFIGGAIDFVIKDVKLLFDDFMSLVNLVTDGFSGALTNLEEGLEESGGDVLEGVMRGVGKNFADAFTATKEYFAPTPAPIVQQASTSNSVSNNTTVNQTILGAGDPRAVGNQVIERGGFSAMAQQAAPGSFAPLNQ